jgi:hypothetical protein
MTLKEMGCPYAVLIEFRIIVTNAIKNKRLEPTKLNEFDLILNTKLKRNGFLLN